MSTQIEFSLNGHQTRLSIQDHWTLLHLLREELGLLGTKEGCGSGECGACTVNIDGKAINSCIYLAREADGRSIQTVEGLASEKGELHPLQRAFVENGGVQCGFCTPGMLMSSRALLEENPNPSEDEIRHALAGNICRCTGYIQIFDSVKAARDAGKVDVTTTSVRDPWAGEED